VAVVENRVLNCAEETREQGDRLIALTLSRPPVWVARALERIRRDYPQARTRTSASGFSISALGPEGFPVSLEIDGDVFRVWFARCMHEFRDVESALKCVDFALSDRAVLKIKFIGATASEWTLGRRDSTTAKVDPLLAGGSGMRVFWQPAREEVFTNRLAS